MLTRYWQPFREMEMIRRQLDQVFDELATNDTSNGLTSLWTPPAELLDESDHFILKLQLPGMKPEDLDIQASREAVAVAGEYYRDERSQGKGDRSEFRYGRFRRVIPLPDAIENEQISADYRDGILWLTLPKTADALNRVVRVNLTSDGGHAATIEAAGDDTNGDTNGDVNAERHANAGLENGSAQQ